MFVSIVCDFGNEDHKTDVENVLKLYGFKNIIANVYESYSIKENALSRLKHDIDKRVDSYDRIRFYQYPIEDTLIITSLFDKKWRRTILKS